MISSKQNLSGHLNNAIVKEYPQLEDLEVTSSLEDQEFKSELYGYNNVKVKGIESDTLNITPTTESQTYSGVYSNVNVAGDSNLIEENIKDGVSIFGKTGTAQLADEELIASFISAIDNSLGANCTKLPSGITSIGDRAFSGCTNLALTELPNSITSIGNYAFSECYKLALTELPNGITSISDAAFNRCYGLVQLKCLGQIRDIGRDAFYCSELSKFSMPNVTQVVTLSNSSAFKYTPIANGTGYIYVPDNLVESFKTATNWSTYADQIKGVSELV